MFHYYDSSDISDLKGSGFKSHNKMAITATAITQYTFLSIIKTPQTLQGSQVLIPTITISLYPLYCQYITRVAGSNPTGAYDTAPHGS